MKVCLSSKKIYKSTIKGKGHSLMEGNQDSCLAFAFKGGVVLSVADGVGSCKHPKMASRAAIKAIRKTARRFANQEVDQKTFTSCLLDKYHKTYRLFQKGMSTTLIFAIVYSDMRIIYGQIGDGLLISSFNGKYATFKKKNDDFSNITESLRHDTKDHSIVYRCKKMEMPGKLNILLCTDGISEDLIPDSYDRFLDHISSFVEFDNVREVDKLLKNWPTAKSLDDKTLAVASFEFKGV